MGSCDGGVPALVALFRAPDAGEGKTPYACTFHWFRLGDGRICGLDVIRSDDTGQLGLRVFVVGEDGTIENLVRIAPAAAWAPFATDAKPDALQADADVLGRGPGWIAGHARSEGAPGGIGEVRFDLEIQPETVGIGTGEALGLSLLYLTIEDFRRARTTGTLIVDGERHAVDGLGPCSVHYGSKLPHYAYVATVPRGGSQASDLLLASAAGDDVRYLGKLLGGVSATYAYLADAPIPLLQIGVLEHPFQIGGHRIELGAVQRFEHQLLGMATVTGTGQATLVTGAGERLDLGQAIFDLRGETYVSRAP